MGGGGGAALCRVLTGPAAAWCTRPQSPFFFLTGVCFSVYRSGAGIMEADDRQVTTVFTVQPSFHHRQSTNRVLRSVTIVGERAVTPHETLPSSANDEVRCDCTFADDGNAT